MKIHKQTETQLVLKGIPGRAIWMVACVGIGLLLSLATAWFAGTIYQQQHRLALAHLPLGVGFLVGQVIFWTGAVTLAIGRVVLILDLQRGIGEYLVRSPIVDAGKPCRFKLKDIHSDRRWEPVTS